MLHFYTLWLETQPADGRQGVSGRVECKKLGRLNYPSLSHSQLLEATDVLPPPFPDPFHMGTIEEEVTRQLTPKGYEKKKLRYGQVGGRMGE